MPSNHIIFPLGSSETTLNVVGGKGMNLNRLIQNHFRVPEAFLMATSAYQEFLSHNGLEPQIAFLIQNTDVADLYAVETASKNIRSLFQDAEIPKSIVQDILEVYQAFSGSAVAVRSSGIAEDLPDKSYAGQHESFLNISGQEALLNAVKQCWSSLWTPRAIVYRSHLGGSPSSVALAVVVQKMVLASASGVLFTLNPITGNPDEMVINAAWGLGEAIVNGSVTPDFIVIDKKSCLVKSIEIGEKRS